MDAQTRNFFLESGFFFVFVKSVTLYSCLNVKEHLARKKFKCEVYVKFKWQQLDSNPQPLSS